MAHALQHPKVQGHARWKWQSKVTACVHDAGQRGQATHTLEVTTLERDLGVLVADDLSLGAQCRAAAATANWKFGIFKKTFTSRSRLLWEKLWKIHIRPHLEHAGQAWAPYLERDIKVLERVQRRVSKHIAGMSGLTYSERCAELDWTMHKERRRRGDAILFYQHHHGNAELEIDWHRVAPLSQIDGPAGGVRANELRLEPPRVRCRQRENFLATRVAEPMRHLPNNIMNSASVNAFKNAYDAHMAKR